MVLLGALLLVLSIGSPAASAAGQTMTYVYHGNSDATVSAYLERNAGTNVTIEVGY